MNLFELNDNYKTLASRDDLDPTILKIGRASCRERVSDNV